MGQAKRLRNCGNKLGHPVCSKKQGPQGVGGVVKGGALTGRPQKEKMSAETRMQGLEEPWVCTKSWSH